MHINRIKNKNSYYLLQNQQHGISYRVVCVCVCVCVCVYVLNFTAALKVTCTQYDMLQLDVSILFHCCCWWLEVYALMYTNHLLHGCVPENNVAFSGSGWLRIQMQWSDAYEGLRNISGTLLNTVETELPRLLKHGASTHVCLPHGLGWIRS